MKPTTPQDALAYFLARPPSTIHLGLDRMRQALALLKNPESRFPAVHVAGTNGKGSTCAYVASCLRAAGYKVGLYTSPHLERVNERIAVDGAPLDDETLGCRILEVLERLPNDLELTFFELGTLVAFWHFAAARVDIAVIETGLGGRLDATNCCRPIVTAISPISVDHTEFLGHSLGEIAKEKAGIFKSGVRAVSGRQGPEALAVLKAAAASQGTSLKVLGEQFFVDRDGEAQAFGYRGLRTTVKGLVPSLAGPHQVDNAALAVACLEQVEDQGFAVSVEAARQGLRDTRWPGRLETFAGLPKVVLDGAHNVGGIEALVAAIDSLFAGKPIHLVFGVLADKDASGMMARLFPKVTAVYLPRFDSPRAVAPSELLDKGRRLASRVEAFESVSGALEAACEGAGRDGLVLGAGSLVLVGQLRSLLR